MRRIAAVLPVSLCLMITAMIMSAPLPVCAGTLSGDEQTGSTEQTVVTAQVEAEEEPTEPEPEEPPGGEEPDGGKPDGGKTDDRLKKSVRTGDYNVRITLLFLLLLGSMLIIADRIRRLSRP